MLILTYLLYLLISLFLVLHYSKHKIHLKQDLKILLYFILNNSICISIFIMFNILQNPSYYLFKRVLLLEYILFKGCMDILNFFAVNLIINVLPRFTY